MREAISRGCARWGTTAAWATAPLMAWFSGHPFGQPLAMTLLVSGYVLVFAQLRSSPKQAVVISSPYGVSAAVIAAFASSASR